MKRCPHCGAINPSNELSCVKCYLDLHARPRQGKPVDPFPSTRTLIIFLAIVVGIGLLIWFIAALGASGLSDT